MLAHGMSVTQRPLPQPAGHVVASPSAHDLFPYGLSSPIRHGMPATPPRFETPPPTVPPKPLSPHTSPFKTPQDHVAAAAEHVTCRAELSFEGRATSSRAFPARTAARTS